MRAAIRTRDLPIDDVALEAPGILNPGEGVDWNNDDSARLGALEHSLRICRLLADEELSLYELAERTGLCTRTVRRYIYALQMAGLDVIARKPRQYYQPATYRLDRRSWHGLLYLPED